MDDVVRHTFGQVQVVGVRCEVAGLDHVHPCLAIGDQAVLEGRAAGIARANQPADPLVVQKILQHVPAKFVRELEALYQALLLQPAQWALGSQLDGFGQCAQRFAEIGKTLLPADVSTHVQITTYPASATRLAMWARASSTWSMRIRHRSPGCRRARAVSMAMNSP